MRIIDVSRYIFNRKENIYPFTSEKGLSRSAESGCGENGSLQTVPFFQMLYDMGPLGTNTFQSIVKGWRVFQEGKKKCACIVSSIVCRFLIVRMAIVRMHTATRLRLPCISTRRMTGFSGFLS